MVVEERRAYELAADADRFLTEYGCTGDGVIGALAAVGRTATGDVGRFTDYGSTKDVGDVVSVERLVEDGIRVVSGAGDDVASGSVVTEGRLQPPLRNGRPTVEVTRQEEGRYRPTNLN